MAVSVDDEQAASYPVLAAVKLQNKMVQIHFKYIYLFIFFYQFSFIEIIEMSKH